MLEFEIFSLSNAYIKTYGLKEVTSGRLFIREGEPDAAGLASYDIFGLPGTDDRKFNYGYIQLNDLFIHSHVLFELKSIKRLYWDLVMGNGWFILKDGTIEKVDPSLGKIKGSGTGAKFLWKIWDDLDFEYKHLPVGVRSSRLRFLKTLDKKSAFMDKLIIIPPFYRDVDVVSSKKNEINVYYSKLINLASTLEATKAMVGIFDNVSETYIAIQTSLYEFYDFIIKTYGGRKGFIHKYVMGKSIAFSARMVISGADLSGVDSVFDLPTDFEHSVLPLFSAIECFAPFIVHGVVELINNTLNGDEFIWVPKGDGYERVRLASDWEIALTSEYIYNLISIYTESQEHRLDAFTLPLEDGREAPLGFISSKGDIVVDPTGSVNSEVQPLRLIHLLYMAAYNTIKDKHVLITRYPIEDHNNTYPSGITISPYKRTEKLTVNGVEYPDFPVVNYEEDMKVIGTMFKDSLVIFPAYLDALNGDFDGDMLSVLGVFTEEANKDLNDFILSAGNLISLDGSSTRTLGTLASHVIHVLTTPEVVKNG